MRRGMEGVGKDAVKMYVILLIQLKERELFITIL